MNGPFRSDPRFYRCTRARSNAQAPPALIGTRTRVAGMAAVLLDFVVPPADGMIVRSSDRGAAKYPVPGYLPAALTEVARQSAVCYPAAAYLAESTAATVTCTRPRGMWPDRGLYGPF